MAMFDFLKKLKAGRWPAAKPAAGRLILAAFGKHPGWDDHIPGIGIETEAIAQLKQYLYDDGIKGQVDSGAWKKLEADKRLEGFDHVFFWLLPGQSMVGRFWSSTDGKGRKEYPMVLCVDGEEMPLESVLAKSWVELERLRVICQDSRSAEQVHAACRLAQAHLQAAARDQAAASTSERRAPSRPGDVPASAEGKGVVSPKPVPVLTARKRFLEHGRLGPNGVGLLRVLHQLHSGASAASSGGGGHSDAPGIRSCPLRLPLAADSTNEAVLLWVAFLQAAISTAVPLLFLLRNGEDWLDVIIGKPTSDDLFCLQASPKALPLVTEIPYELASEASQRMQTLVPKFLQADSTAIKSDEVPPVLATPERGQARSWVSTAVWWGIGIGVLIGLLLIGYWFPGHGHRTALVSRQPVQAQPFSQQQEHYEIAIRDGRAAYERTNFAEALAQARVALTIKPDDPTASKLMNDAQAQLAVAASIKENGQKFQAALQAGRTALDRTNFAEAMAQAEAALGLKAGDAAATKLRNDAQTQLALATQMKAKEERFQAALQAGRIAFTRTNFAEAQAQAEAALGLKAGDAAAMKLRNDAQTQLALATQMKAKEERFQAALQAGRIAFTRTNFAEAQAQADIALGFKPGDLTATWLKNDAQAQLAAAAQKRANERNYSEAMKPAQDTFDQSTNPPVRTNRPALGGAVFQSFTNGMGMEFVRLQARTGHAMWVGKYEVTQGQFHALMGALPDGQAATGDDFPVANVPFKDALEFCRRLGDQDGKTYSLPSKAEWLEVAGLPAQQLEHAWTNLIAQGILEREVTSWQRERPLQSPQPVGSRGAQANQVCDLIGNVREWVIADDGGESAGFAYNSVLLRARELFLQPSPDIPAIAANTGFRCFLRDHQ